MSTLKQIRILAGIEESRQDWTWRQPEELSEKWETGKGLHKVHADHMHTIALKSKNPLSHLEAARLCLRSSVYHHKGNKTKDALKYLDRAAYHLEQFRTKFTSPTPAQHHHAADDIGRHIEMHKIRMGLNKKGK